MTDQSAEKMDVRRWKKVMERKKDKHIIQQMDEWKKGWMDDWDIVSLWSLWVSLCSCRVTALQPPAPPSTPALPACRPWPGGHAEVTTCRRYVTHGWQECELCSLTHSPQTLHHCNGVPTRPLMQKNGREAPSSGVFLPQHPLTLLFSSCCFFHFPPLACTLSPPLLNHLHPSLPPQALRHHSRESRGC